MQHTAWPTCAFFFCLLTLALTASQLQAQTNDKKPLESSQAKPLAPARSAPSRLPDESGSNASLYDAGTQRIERIHIEDGGSRVDELRYGGVVERIVVQPKFDVPAYEILPNDKVTSRPRGRDGAPPTHSQRVWNVLGF